MTTNWENHIHGMKQRQTHKKFNEEETPPHPTTNNCRMEHTMHEHAWTLEIHTDAKTVVHEWCMCRQNAIFCSSSTFTIKPDILTVLDNSSILPEQVFSN